LERVGKRKPNFTFFMLRYFMMLIVGVTCGFWIWSDKTFSVSFIIFFKISGKAKKNFFAKKFDEKLEKFSSSLGVNFSDVQNGRPMTHFLSRFGRVGWSLHIRPNQLVQPAVPCRRTGRSRANSRKVTRPVPPRHPNNSDFTISGETKYICIKKHCKFLHKKISLSFCQTKKAIKHCTVISVW